MHLAHHLSGVRLRSESNRVKTPFFIVFSHDNLNYTPDRTPTRKAHFGRRQRRSIWLPRADVIHCLFQNRVGGNWLPRVWERSRIYNVIRIICKVNRKRLTTRRALSAIERAVFQAETHPLIRVWTLALGIAWRVDGLVPCSARVSADPHAGRIYEMLYAVRSGTYRFPIRCLRRAKSKQQHQA